DVAVPGKMRGVGEAFYGRQRVYEAALVASDRGPLAAALARNVFGASAAPGVEQFAAYVRAAVRHLAAQDGGALRRGVLGFPDPGQRAVEDDPLTPCCDKLDDEARA